MMIAATAAMMLSDLDGAGEWLKKAEAAGMQKQQVAELREAIDAEQPKVKVELGKRAAVAKADDLPRVKITTS